MRDEENKFIDKAGKECAKNSATIQALVTATLRWIENEKNKLSERKGKYEENITKIDATIAT